MTRISKITIVLILISNFCYSQPNADIRWLMSEPASLLDIGIQNLRMLNSTYYQPVLLDSIGNEAYSLPHYPGGGVGYNYDNNTITITASLIGEPDEKLCAEFLEKYIDIVAMGYTPKKSGPMNQFALNWLGSKFTHIGYSASSRDPELNNRLSKLFIIQVRISESSDPMGKRITCSRRLRELSPKYEKSGFK